MGQRTRPVPDFMVIGAMKCATSTLHEQLAAQPSVQMSEPKEPCYFSDDDRHALGPDWYRGCWPGATDDRLLGESSTHSTKLPHLPRTVERVVAEAPRAHFVYLMRHPVRRLQSHHVHAWIYREAGASIDEALDLDLGLVEYGCYARQLEPWLDAFGPERILPVFSERLRVDPDGELERIARHVGLEGPVSWNHGEDLNRTGDRIRVHPWVDAVLQFPPIAAARRRVLPESVRERLKRGRRLEQQELSPDRLAEVTARFDEDLERLGALMGLPGLSCATWTEIARTSRPAFVS